MKTIKISEWELKDYVESLIKQTQNADMFQGWSKRIRFSPEESEFEITNWLSQSTSMRDNYINVLSMESWDVRDRIDDEHDYVYDAYDKLRNTKVNREDVEWEELKSDHEDVAELALESVEEDYDISEDVDFLMDQAKYTLENNLNMELYEVEFIN